MSRDRLENSIAVTNGNPAENESMPATGSPATGPKYWIRLVLTIGGGFLIHLALGALFTFGK